jgi:tRNA1Val (adenine37-N6)-methyltransferase
MISLKKYSENIENESFTVDKIYSKEIEICQKKHGYRFNSDSVILSWFIHRILGSKKIKHSVEIGSGTGVIPIILNKRGFPAKTECIEIQTDLFELLKRNISVNGLEDFLAPSNADFREFTKNNTKKFDLIYTNPPYFGNDTGKINTDNEKAVSKHEFFGSLSDFILCSGNILRPGGHFAFIYPLAKIFFALGGAYKNDFVLKHLFLFRENPDSIPVSFCAHLVYKGEPGNSLTEMITIRDNKGNYSETGMEIMYENKERQK